MHCDISRSLIESDRTATALYVSGVWNKRHNIKEYSDQVHMDFYHLCIQWMSTKKLRVAHQKGVPGGKLKVVHLLPSLECQRKPITIWNINMLLRWPQ